MLIALLCLFPAPAEPHPADIAERFGGAALMIREANPVPVLLEYREAIKDRKYPPEGMTWWEWQVEINRAEFVWDVWDDLRIAMKHYDAGDCVSCRQTMNKLRYKIGPEAYAAGRMPEIPERAFWRRDADRQAMPKGEP
jgi:hypothetical protein